MRFCVRGGAGLAQQDRHDGEEARAGTREKYHVFVFYFVVSSFVYLFTSNIIVLGISGKDHVSLFYLCIYVLIYLCMYF